MRSWTFALSVVVHGAIFAVVMWRGKTPPVHRGTEVAVVTKKPKPPQPKPDEEKPKPKPPPPPKPREVVAAPVVAPAPVPPAPAAPGPRVASGLTLSNGPSSGGGIAVAGMTNTPGPSGGPPNPDDRSNRLPPPPKKDVDACDAPDTKPKPMGSVQVEYPDKARADGIEGRIQVRIHVGDDGAVTDVEVVESIDPSLDATVLAILRTWRFQPATHCGRASAGVLAWAQRFELGD